MENKAPLSDYENGLRIFARWIARAYLKDLARESKPSVKSPENQLTAENNPPDRMAISSEADTGGDSMDGSDVMPQRLEKLPPRSTSRRGVENEEAKTVRQPL